MVVSKLKAFMFCTLLVAMASLVVMFYYSVTFSQYSKIGIRYVEMLKTEYFATREMPRGVREKNLNNTALSHVSTYSNASRRHVDLRESLRSNKLHDVIGILNENNSSPKEDLIEKPKTEVAGNNPAQTKPTTSTSESQQRKELNLCSAGSKQVGALYVDQSVPKMEEVEKLLSKEVNGWHPVNKGGSWKPTECKAKVKMALIVPYRNRYEQLTIFVRHMHPLLQRQNLDYRIFIIEQAGDTIFNRAMLFNIGFKEALKFDQYECFIFHDVDLIPEDDRNEYSCPSSPRHLSVAIDKFQYRLPYDTIFGGAGSLSREHFELINGFSNKFWGWGGEDDDLYNRISAKGLKLSRPSMQIGRYKMIQKFHQSAKADDERFAKLQDSAQRMDSDGLNSLKYKVEKVTEYRLYTLVTVDVREAMENQR